VTETLSLASIMGGVLYFLFCFGLQVVSIAANTFRFEEDFLQCSGFLLNLFVNLRCFILI